MKYENKIFGVILIITMLLSFLTMSAFVSAPGTNNFTNNSGGARNLLSNSGIAGNLLNFVGLGITKIIGANPIVHGLIAGAISGISTYSKLKKADVPFVITKDKVNISNKVDDYSGTTEDVQASDFYKNRVMSPDNKENTRKYSSIVLTDKNIFDVMFVQTKDLSSLKDNNSPTFRLSDTTSNILTYNLDGNSVNAQKRDILFEDKNRTIKNSYEYRNLVIKYPQLEYPKTINILLKTADLLSGKWANYLFTPFSTGAQYLRLDNLLETKNFKKAINDSKKLKYKVQPFHLLFNSWTDTNIQNKELKQLDCIDESGMPLGTTGKDVLPKVAFNWDFLNTTNGSTAINGNPLNRLNWCDTLNSKDPNTTNGIYCDATQFSIELLYKIKKIQDYVNQNSGSFTCPTPGVTRDILTDINNVGVTSLDSSYDGSNLVNVNYEIKGGFDNLTGATTEKTFAKLRLVLSEINSGDVLDTKDVTLTAPELINGDYSASDTLNAGLLSGTVNLKVTASIVDLRTDLNTVDQPGDNTLENRFSTNSTECNLAHTSENIKLFAKNITPRFDDQSLVDFKSLLMYDGYSNDFKKDFDEYYRTKFLGTPTFYYDSTTNSGLYKYFVDDNKFKFTSAFSSDPGKLLLQGPGRYKVQLKINFDDDWHLFQNGKMTGSIEVYLTKELPPERDSPLYYMPFDGLVGITTPNARQGYGIDYVGDIINLNQDTNMQTDPFTASNTVNTLSVKEYGKRPGDFAFMNNGQTRGMILSVVTSSTHKNPELNFIPSRPTPVVMKVTSKTNDAYSFYKLNVGNPANLGGEPAHPGMNLAKWTGMGTCEDFTGISAQEAFLNTPDILATDSTLANYTSSQTFAYGVEWPKDSIIRHGNEFLRTIFYTPSNFTGGTGYSELVADSYNNDVTFYSPELNNSSVQDGKKLTLYNSYAKDIKSLKDIYGLVSDKKACINYNPTSLEVYYNPKAVMDSFIKTDSESQDSWINKNGGCIRAGN